MSSRTLDILRTARFRRESQIVIRSRRSRHCSGCQACFGAVATLKRSIPFPFAPRLIDAAERDILTDVAKSRRRGATPVDRRRAEVLRGLVLDGDLSISVGKEYVSGFEASLLLEAEPMAPPKRARSPSMEALTYGASFGNINGQMLAHRLYSYNRLPLATRWQKQLATPDDVLSYCRIGGLGARRAVARVWQEVRRSSADGWIRWQRHGQPPAHALFKLYFDFSITDLPAAMPNVVDVLASTRTVAFKIANSGASLLRPDNTVAYFASLANTLDAARALGKARLTATGPGVPFAAPVAVNRALAWGVDPPPEYCRTRGLSWRLWIAGRLAAHLMTARMTGASAISERLMFALHRLRLDGIDIHRWRPERLAMPVL